MPVPHKSYVDYRYSASHDAIKCCLQLEFHLFLESDRCPRCQATGINGVTVAWASVSRPCCGENMYLLLAAESRRSSEAAFFVYSFSACLVSSLMYKRATMDCQRTLPQIHGSPFIHQGGNKAC